MGLLGDIEQVKVNMRGAEGVTFGADADSRLTEIQLEISSVIEEKTDRTFGEAATPESRIVYVGGEGVLLLPVPARSISKVETGGTVTVAGATGFTELATDQYVFDPINTDGHILGIRLATGAAWYGIFGVPSTPVRVTGIWSDRDAGGEVPADLTAIANYLIAERYKIRTASPAGFIGPDGSVVPIRDPWKDQTVITVLNKYRANRVPVF